MIPHPSVPQSIPLEPVDEFDAPDTLLRDERAVWVRQAPHAFKAGTLTRGSSLTFERYCTLVVKEQHEGQSSGNGGPKHLAMLRLINLLELQFLLAPNGRPMPAAAAKQSAPVSKLSRFRT